MSSLPLGSSTARSAPWTSFVLCFALFALASCTSMRRIAPADPGILRAELAVGDEVVVTTAHAEHVTGSVTAIGEQSLTLRRSDTPHAEPIELPLADITAVEVRRGDTGRSVFAALGGSALLIAVLAATAVILFAIALG